jgi:hypothetical protein
LLQEPLKPVENGISLRHTQICGHIHIHELPRSVGTLDDEAGNCQPTQRKLFDRFADMLKPDGWLVAGHSESLQTLSSRFEMAGRTIYRRAK